MSIVTFTAFGRQKLSKLHVYPNAQGNDAAKASAFTEKNPARRDLSLKEQLKTYDVNLFLLESAHFLLTAF